MYELLFELSRQKHPPRLRREAVMQEKLPREEREVVERLPTEGYDGVTAVSFGGESGTWEVGEREKDTGADVVENLCVESDGSGGQEGPAAEMLDYTLVLKDETTSCGKMDRSDDLTKPPTLETSMEMSWEERCEWFRKRILEMDSRYGQLDSAYELCCQATECLEEWPAGKAKQPYEELFAHTERLYNCVYLLHLSSCTLIRLSDWSSLSLEEQAMLVVGTDEEQRVQDVAAIVSRLDTVFISQRKDNDYSLDGLFSWLVQSIVSKPSLSNLEIAAELLHRSHPSLPLERRYIQSNDRLIETVLDAIYSVDDNELRTGVDGWRDHWSALMDLAKIVCLESQKPEVLMKGAYAALYSLNYGVAYDLTIQVIRSVPSELGITSLSGYCDDLTLLHLISLISDLVSASSFKSWSKKRKLCYALMSTPCIASSDLFAHQVTDLVLSWVERIETIQALMGELGLSDEDLEQRRLAGAKQTGSGGVEAVLMNELKVVIDLLHEERKDRRFLLRLLQLGFQLVRIMATSDVDTESLDNDEPVQTFLRQMVQICVLVAVDLVCGNATPECDDWQQYLELGCSYLMLWSSVCPDDVSFKAFCSDEVLSLVSPQHSGVENEAVAHAKVAIMTRLHHFFLVEAVDAREEASQEEKEDISARRQTLTRLFSSYDATRRAAAAFDEQSTMADPTMHGLIASKHRYEVFLELAQQCQDQLAFQKKSQELEQMSSFFNSELDLERFSQDERYREQQIMVLATTKEHLKVARQFAAKYGIDEYRCVLAYVRNVLLFPSGTSQMARHDQLEQAFRSGQVDVLEDALQRPFCFGDFLLGTAGSEGIYGALEGADHVGILLVLRMVLECSKRMYQQSTDSLSPNRRSFFPLSKVVTDRVTLLFVCLKKLKDIVDSFGEGVEGVDFKLISAASSSADLLTPVQSSHVDAKAGSKRQVAVAAVRPLLNGKSVKLVTKVLRKLHRVTPSAMVMIYMNDLLAGIWRERGAASSSSAALSADLGTYAYESCVPCLSVLTNEHLLLFHHLFLYGPSGKLPELLVHLNVAEEFYGQSLSGMQSFSALLSTQKRMEIVADTLSLFQTKYNSWQTSGTRSNVSSASSTSSASSVSWDPAQYKKKEEELHYLECELAEHVCYVLLSEVDEHSMTSNPTGPVQSLAPVKAAVRTWFAMDATQKAASQDEVLWNGILVALCQRVASAEIATLLMEIVLRAGGNNSDVDQVIAQSYKAATADVVTRSLGLIDGSTKQTAHWAERLVWMWVAGSASPSSNQQLAELQQYLRTTQGSVDGEDRSVYERVVGALAQSPSMMLKEIAAPRLEQMATSNARDQVRQAVLSQWEQQISQLDEQREWAKASVLSSLLVSSSGSNDGCSETKLHFGLSTKAVWSTLLAQSKLESGEGCRHILETPSHEIFDAFDALFEEMLVFVEAQAGGDDPTGFQFAEQATVVLGNLLVRYEDPRGSRQTPEQVAAAWRNEQERALKARVESQFQVVCPATNEGSLQSEDHAACWLALFARGYWGASLLTWYSTHAYSKLSRDEDVTEAVVLAHWEAGNVDVACQLLLMCPFDCLREKYTPQVLASVLQLPRNGSWRTIMELVLLRFDVSVLLQHGLYSSVVAFLLQDRARNDSSPWTASGDYVVCALVVQGELSAAGRLNCALRRAHPLLWDVENARLLLANFLRALTATSRDAERSKLQQKVYTQVYRHFASVVV